MTDLGDRMKEYEAVEAQRRLLPLVPALARLDGRAFHTFTRGMKRPYDERFSQLMADTCKFLVEETQACIGYVQSDEITLAWLAPHPHAEIFFAGRIQKMTSQLAALATAFFNDRKNGYFANKEPGAYFYETVPEYVGNTLATFDCRVWNVPNAYEAANAFLWRENDATKNSIAMAAQSMYSHKELHGKNGNQMHEMLHQKGVNWNDYPAFFKRGLYFQRKRTERPFTFKEIENLPPKHAARTDPNLTIERSDVFGIAMPPFSKVINREKVIFEGAEPQVLDLSSDKA